MHIKFCNIKTGEIKSEKGFTLLEVIFVVTITGILSSTLILPFSSSIKQGTQPEIYNTATYLAVDEMELKRKESYPAVSIAIDAATNPLTTVTNPPLDIGGRPYTVQTVSEYVTHSVGPPERFIYSATLTEFIRVTATVSNPNITNDVVLWEILTRDVYNRYAN